MASFNPRAREDATPSLRDSDIVVVFQSTRP